MMSASRWIDHGIDKESADEVVVAVDLADCLWEGKTSKGLALSRAREFNRTADEPIIEVNQLNNGTIEYLNTRGTIVSKVVPPSGTHTDDSQPGSLRV